MKRFFFYVIFILFILVSLALTGEMFFRIFRGSPNPLIGVSQKGSEYLFQPNAQLDKKSSIPGEFQYVAHINQFGYRGKNFEAMKPRGALRVLAVGDSFTFGVGAQDDQTIPAVMETQLKNSGVNAEVINAGIGHASPIRHLVNLRDIHLKYKPDLVVLLLDLTDIRDDWYSERNAIFDEQGNIVKFDLDYINGKRDWWRTIVHKSAFAKYVNDKIIRSIRKIQILGFKRYIMLKSQGKKAKAEIANLKKQVSDELQIEYDGMLFLRGREKKDLILKHWPRTAKYLTAIKELLDKQGIPMVLVVYPHGIYVGADEWNEGRKAWGFEQNKLYTDYYPFDLVESFAAEHGIPFINTLENFLNVPKDKYFFDYDGHMNPKGYRIVAESIFNNQVFSDQLQKVILK